MSKLPAVPAPVQSVISVLVAEDEMDPRVDGVFLGDSPETLQAAKAHAVTLANAWIAETVKPLGDPEAATAYTLDWTEDAMVLMVNHDESGTEAFFVVAVTPVLG